MGFVDVEGGLDVDRKKRWATWRAATTRQPILVEET